MLLHLIVKFIVMQVIVFTVVIGLIRARPYENEAARALLFPPEGCLMPCWEGIRPGHTRIDEALSLLRAHPWITEIDESFYHLYGVYWRWSPLRPPLIQERGSNTLWFDSQNRVSSVELLTHIRLGDARLLLGAPASWTWAFPQSDLIQINNLYPDHYLVLFYNVPCSASMNEFWHTEIGVAWHSEVQAGGQVGDIMPGDVLRCTH